MSEHNMERDQPSIDRTPHHESGSPAGTLRGSRRWIASLLLLATLVATGVGLAAWKVGSVKEADAAAASQPEPAESVTTAVARTREHRQTVSAIGTVLATRSVTLRNELAGTVRQAALRPGQIVEAGDGARAARRLGRGGRAGGAEGAGHAGADAARPQRAGEPDEGRVRERGGTAPAPSATSPWRRSRAPRPSSPARRSAPRSGPVWAWGTSTRASISTKAPC